MEKKLNNFEGIVYLTVRTKEFLFEDRGTAEGMRKIENNLVDSNQDLQCVISQREARGPAADRNNHHFKKYKICSFLPVKKCAVQEMRN